MELKWKHFIDSSKGLTPLVILGCMHKYDRMESPTAWAYFGMHGSYGLLWVMKSMVFPDAAWERPNKSIMMKDIVGMNVMDILAWLAGRGTGLVIFSSLAVYWSNIYLICKNKIEAPAWVLGVASFVYSLGVFLHFSSDMQKHVRLMHKRGLITDMLFSRTRNPNYLGELLIYGSFSSIALHPFPPLYLLLNVLCLWLPNMLSKDKSISRHAGWEEYSARSWLLFPKFF